MGAIILRQLRGYELLISGRSIDLDSQAFPPALNQVLFENNKKIYHIAGGNDPVLSAIVRRQVWHLSMPESFEKSRDCSFAGDRFLWLRNCSIPHWMRFYLE
ncbi:hypothetical protein DC083_01100 [Ignatzschineria ureiclastica]|uniref:Uncharacterized protein n=1 Tax=Ignatzschineria ureiclastica TaxID=472582 RepID=A0A2U2AGP1_9GAMM|nr:hypothetical protein [Ignatzschineria ureiclastica]PWD81821.1 hypothetical protein DC083_01100 [Ignatzschineria ureiclastica]GGZ90742.1 hypothetical protein GCM10007162_02130 [Ignatzschineria ureiclastica]